MRTSQLSEYIDQFQNLLVDNDIIAIKDANCNYQFATAKWLSCHGFKDVEQIRDKNDRTLLSQSGSSATPTYIQSLEQLDLECLKTKKQIIAHTLFNTANFGPRLFIVQKNLIIREGKILGIRDIYRPLLARNYMYKLLEKFVGDNDFQGLKNVPELTEREQVILFLLTIGYTPKLISWILDNYTNKTISAKTISNIIYQQLYPKFKVNSLNELTKTALSLNIAQNIPPILEKTDFIIKIQ